jgi:glycerol uptake facilitator protein
MDRTPTLTQKFVAELLGTAFLTWIGAGSITASVYLLNGAKPATAFTMADLGMIALAFAFAIAAMVYTIGHISGCHINPAVTFSLAVTRRISWNEAGVYWIAQFLGGIVGALVIALAFGWATAAKGPGLGATNFGGAKASMEPVVAGLLPLLWRLLAHSSSCWSSWEPLSMAAPPPVGRATSSA